MPKNGQPTRERLLDAAEKLVERNGFAATSVEMILADAQSSKGAFFHHFATKRDLSHALVQRYVDADLGVLANALSDSATHQEPVARLLAFLDVFVDRYEALVNEPACLYIAMLIEEDLLDERNRGEFQRAILGWRAAVSQLVCDAYAASPSPGVRPEPQALADQLFIVFEGAYLMCRADGSPVPMHTHLMVFRQLVASLFAQTS